jgi:hypothetical protein
MKNIRIGLSERVALWAGRRASEENISVAKFVSRVLENQTRSDYRRAHRKWKRIAPVKGIEAARRMSREQSHARR